MTIETTFRAATVALAVLLLEAQTGYAQTGNTQGGYGNAGQRNARPRDFVALQDDLRLLDDSLYAMSGQNPRRKEFERRAGVIRTDVSNLVEQVNRNGADQSNVVIPRSEVRALRQRITLLRDDVDGVPTQRQARGNAALVIPSGTEIQVMLDQALSSETANVEDRFEASTVAAIQVNGRTVIPAGATVSGFVSEVRSNKRLRKDGYLKLEFNTLTLDGGRPMEIRSQVVSVAESHSGDHTLRNGGLGAILGAVVGGIFEGKKGALIGAVVGAGGGVLATKGEEVDLPQGTLITLRLDGPMTMARR
jgi:hypothetical protein